MENSEYSRVQFSPGETRGAYWLAGEDEGDPGDQTVGDQGLGEPAQDRGHPALAAAGQMSAQTKHCVKFSLVPHGWTENQNRMSDSNNMMLRHVSPRRMS